MNEDAAGLEDDAIAGVAREPNKEKKTVRVKSLQVELLEQ
jgi:hypothetical protein